MRVAFDTNVLIDAIASRGDHASAQGLLMCVAKEKIEGVVTANSITDIYYIVRKLIGDEGARNAIWNLMTVLDVAELDGSVCGAALTVPMKDYEDAILAVCAAKDGCNYVVSRDQGFLKAEGSPIPVISPDDLIGILQEN